jgi:hypothetical protein
MVAVQVVDQAPPSVGVLMLRIDSLRHRSVNEKQRTLRSALWSGLLQRAQPIPSRLQRVSDSDS